MIQHGKPPFTECSSRGDKRFSAFYARIKHRGNKSIEEIYQAAKVFKDGRTGLTWKEAKGKKAINQEECTNLYKILWEEYITENPELLTVLKTASGLSDLFGQRGHCCQATELWRIRNSKISINGIDEIYTVIDSSDTGREEMTSLSWCNPKLLTPPHKITKPEQVLNLAVTFALYGWDKAEPALVGYRLSNGSIQLLSGTHRHAAAILAEIYVPVVIWKEEEIQAAHGDVEKWAKIMASGNGVLRC